MSSLTVTAALEEIYAGYVDVLATFPDILKTPPLHMEITPLDPERPFSYQAAYESLRELSKMAGYAYAVPEREQLAAFGEELANLLLTNMQENGIDDKEICECIADICFAGFVVLYLMSEAKSQARDIPTTTASLIHEAFCLENFVDAIERLDRAYHVYRVLMEGPVAEDLTEPLTAIPLPNAVDLKSHLSQPLTTLFCTIKINQTPK